MYGRDHLSRSPKVSCAVRALTLQEIGNKYDLARERVRQLESQLTKKLRDYMAKSLPDFGELSLAKDKE